MLVTKYGYFWNFLIDNTSYLDHFVHHTYNVSICNLILKLLVVDGVEKNEFDDSDQKKEPEDKFFVFFYIITEIRNRGSVYWKVYFNNLRNRKTQTK